MDSFAQLPTSEREVYFIEAGSRLGLPSHIIEKDFWVCWTLKRIFALDCLAGDVLFKGGTSLSKAHGLIERFSEDVDLSIHRFSLGFAGDLDPANPELSNKQRRRQSDALKAEAQAKVMQVVQPELQALIEALLSGMEWTLLPDASDPDGQSLAFTYPRTGVTLASDAYLPPSVKIEFGARSDHFPASPKKVVPYLAEALPDALTEPEVEVKAMDAVRTFWEKATILHQMAHLPQEKRLPARYSRHYCDLANMIQAGVGDAAAVDTDLLAAVVQHKMTFYRSAWASYDTAKRGSLRLLPDDSRLPELATDLKSMEIMFFHGAPKMATVLETLRTWQNTFNQTD